MPELPEIETIRLGLKSFLGAKPCITASNITRADLRFPFPDNFTKRITGCHITTYKRHGKYLLLTLDDRLIWLIHFGMSGKLILRHTNNDFPEKHSHLFVSFSNAKKQALYLCYHDPRRFGFMDLFDADKANDNRFLQKLGRDPIADKIDADMPMSNMLMNRAKNRNTTIKAFLMEQGNIAGMGNIYCSEALWRAHIHPQRSAGSLTKPQWQLLTDAIISVLAEAIEAGGSSFSDFTAPEGSLGYFQHQWNAYGQADTKCKNCAKGTIRKIIQQNRASFYCDECQE